MAVGQKRVPKNPIGKRKHRLKPVVPRGWHLFDSKPCVFLYFVVLFPFGNDVNPNRPRSFVVSKALKATN